MEADVVRGGGYAEAYLAGLYRDGFCLVISVGEGCGVDSKTQQIPFGNDKDKEAVVLHPMRKQIPFG